MTSTWKVQQQLLKSEFVTLKCEKHHATRRTAFTVDFRQPRQGFHEQAEQRYLPFDIFVLLQDGAACSLMSDPLPCHTKKYKFTTSAKQTALKPIRFRYVILIFWSTGADRRQFRIKPASVTQSLQNLTWAVFRHVMLVLWATLRFHQSHTYPRMKNCSFFQYRWMQVKNELSFYHTDLGDKQANFSLLVVN